MGQDQLTFFSGAEGSARCISISLDKVYITIVCIVLLLVVSFSLGVEKGRKMLGSVSRAELEQFTIVETATAEPVSFSVPTGAVTLEVPQAPAAQQIEEIAVKSDVIHEIPVVEEVKDPKFTIQVASFAKRSYAEKEAAILEAKGYKTTLKTKGKWIALTAGAYSDKVSAGADLKSLKKKYKDCYIRNW